jgi:hypothetical protein
MHRAAVALLLGAACLAPVAARAQSRWEDQVHNQIKHAGRILEDKGYTMTHDEYSGNLKESESEYLNITLHAGTDYAIIGVCDNDCSDLDLRIFDADGDEVDNDVQTDDVPIVHVAPTETQRYRLKVIMATCKTSPCFYGIGVFGK